MFEGGIPIRSELNNTDEPSNRLESLLNTTLALIFALTPQGHLVKFNRACEVLTGYVFEEVANKVYWELFLSADEALVAAAAFKDSDMGYFLNQREGGWFTKTRAYRFIEWSNTAVVDDEGIVQLLVGTGIDVTEKKEAQRRSIELEIQAAKMRELAEFVGKMAHDIRTPLAMIMLAGDLINRKNQQPQLLPQIERMGVGIQYLAQLVDDTQFVFDAINVGALFLNPVNLNEMIRGLYTEFADQIAAKQLEFHLNLQENLPTVQGDRSLLYRAIRNVIDNAIRYTLDKGSITIRTVGQNTSNLIEVRDSGVGISSDDLPHIFEYFYKADKARTQLGAGSGLGLAITKQVMQSHNGRIEVDSTPGFGSTFQLILPHQNSL